MKIEFYQNFSTTLSKLQEFLSEEIKTDRDRAGLIQGFEFTFEQCWKAIQKKSGEEGVQVVSPKQAFSNALGRGWISQDEESIWLDMIKDRNLTSHTYKEALALEIEQSIKDIYEPAFVKILEKMKRD